jgi:hypothetical protein
MSGCRRRQRCCQLDATNVAASLCSSLWRVLPRSGFRTALPGRSRHRTRSGPG